MRHQSQSANKHMRQQSNEKSEPGKRITPIDKMEKKYSVASLRATTQGLQPQDVKYSIITPREKSERSVAYSAHNLDKIIDDHNSKFNDTISVSFTNDAQDVDAQSLKEPMVRPSESYQILSEA